MERVCVIGSGSFGTTLALLLARKGLQVLLYGRDAGLIAGMADSRVNEAYLPGHALPQNISLTSDRTDALLFSARAVVAVPFKGYDETFAWLKSRPDLQLLLTTKGLRPGTFQLPFQVAAESFPPKQISVLSGPNLAREMAAGLPCATVVASQDREAAAVWQAILSSPLLRAYTSGDVVGVSLGGALKNVYAIGAGVSDTLFFGANSKAAYLCRALAEMVRVAPLFGSKVETFFGLAGLGDLLCTCQSELSRNYRVGVRLAKGEGREAIVSASRQVAEGIDTTEALRALARNEAVELPIAESVYEVLYKGRDPKEALLSLMSRPLKSEW